MVAAEEEEEEEEEITLQPGGGRREQRERVQIQNKYKEKNIWYLLSKLTQSSCDVEKVIFKKNENLF